MSIVTRNGDGGITKTLDGRVVRKDDPLLEFLGTLDELNSFLGLARHQLEAPEKEVVEKIQEILFKLGARAGYPERYADLDEEIEWIERHIASLETGIELKGFVIPGATEASALLDVCRTIVRRAERRIIPLLRKDERLLNSQIFLNRLSDFLFLMARTMESKGRM